MYGEIKEILGDIFFGIIPQQHLLSDVLQNVFEVCSELGHVYSSQRCV